MVLALYGHLYHCPLFILPLLFLRINSFNMDSGYFRAEVTSQRYVPPALRRPSQQIPGVEVGDDPDGGRAVIVGGVPF